LNISTCNSYTLNSQIYNTSGTYYQTIPNAFGCDSVITLNLTINRKFTAQTIAICEGTSFYTGGANQTAAGIYKDTLRTSLGCDSIVTTTLLVHPKPVPDLGADRNLCLNAPLNITPGVFKSYLWQDNSTQSSFTISTKGSYWVKVTDTNNCTATDTLKILAIDTLPADFLPADQLLCYGSIFKISVPGYKNYQWSTGDVSGTVSLSGFGNFYLTVTDNKNCVGKDTILLLRNYNCVAISIPNAFTPNKDGINDIFKPFITQEVFEYSFLIFNRYGQKIFETNDYLKGWDGTFKGTAQPRNSYVYLISFKNINGVVSENKGIVTLIR
jgi:gliding motility-associated-like protein